MKNKLIALKKIKPINEDKYKDIDLDHLVLYSLGCLNKIGAELTYENAAVASFKLFPRKFSLSGFPEHPDSDRVMSSLSRCCNKPKQWVGGNSRQGFILTERSKRYLKETERLLNRKISKTRKASSQTRRKEAIVNEAKTTKAYEKFKAGKGNDISPAELCYLLQATLDSSKDVLRNNFYALKEYTNELQDKEVQEFNKFLEAKFKEFLLM